MRLPLLASTLAALALLPILGSAADEGPNEGPPTVLVLKNGAEVRGVFVEMRDAQYMVRLIDGRVMGYPVAEVERMSLTEESGSPRPAEQAAPAVLFTCSVFISEEDLDKRYYTVVKKEIKVSKKWYGSTDEMFDDLARKAQKKGAEGVIRVRTWHAPSGFSWAAPHAGGTGINWTEAGRAALPDLPGRCY